MASHRNAVVVAADLEARSDPELARGSSSIFHLPSPRAFARHALPHLIETTIGPALIFYIVLVTAGFKGAVVAALGWSYLAAARRVVRREPLPGLLVLGIVLLSVRTLISFMTGSAFIYFLQPTMGSMIVAVLFLASAVVRKPLIERMAHDFCPLDADMMAKPFLRSFFLRLSLLWGVVLLANGGFVLWLLVQSSLKAFVVERTILSVVVTVSGIAVSTIWFVRVLRKHGISVRFGAPEAPALVPVVANDPIVVVEPASPVRTLS